MKKIHLLGWDEVCKEKVDGGAGLHKLCLQNKALGVKLIWKIYESLKRLWCQIMQRKYLDNLDPAIILTVANLGGGSVPWSYISNCRSLITSHLSW